MVINDRDVHVWSVIVLCEYSKIFEIRIVTLLFDSKWIQLFEIFKYLNLVHNAVFGDCNGDGCITKTQRIN